MSVLKAFLPLGKFGMPYTWVGKIPWRRERLPTPVFWPGEFHGLYSPWGGKESDMTDMVFTCFPNVGRSASGQNTMYSYFYFF